MTLIRRAGQTANEALRDLGIRHAVYFQRLKSAEVQRVLAYLNRNLLPDVAAAYRDRLQAIEARGADLGPWTTHRLADIEQTVQGLIDGAMREVAATNAEHLTELGQYESEWQVRTLGQATPIAVDWRTPSPVTIRSIVSSEPFSGDVLSGWWVKLAQGTQAVISREISTGLSAGETVDQIVRRLRGEDGYGGAFGYTRRGAESIVRTAATHVSAEARDATYAENADIVKGWQFVATLDARTTLVCMEADGKEYGVNEATSKMPPLHFNCRSTTVPVLKSWKELGIPLKESTPSTRASLDGQVAEGTTYPEWLKRQPNAVQNEVLGKGRADLFRGGLTIDRFVDDQGRPLTLKALRAIEGG